MFQNFAGLVIGIAIVPVALGCSSDVVSDGVDASVIEGVGDSAESRAGASLETRAGADGGAAPEEGGGESGHRDGGADGGAAIEEDGLSESEVRLGMIESWKARGLSETGAACVSDGMIDRFGIERVVSEDGPTAAELRDLQDITADCEVSLNPRPTTTSEAPSSQ